MTKNFKCKKCGKCCKFMLLELKDNVNDDFKQWFAFHLLGDNQEFATIKNRKEWILFFTFIKLENRNFLKINLPCFFLSKDNMCKIHKSKYRPKMCKDFYCEDPRFKHVKKLLL